MYFISHKPYIYYKVKLKNELTPDLKGKTFFLSITLCFFYRLSNWSP